MSPVVHDSFVSIVLTESRATYDATEDKHTMLQATIMNCDAITNDEQWLPMMHALQVVSHSSDKASEKYHAMKSVSFHIVVGR